jgi:lipid-A-disaccharide synthase
MSQSRSYTIIFSAGEASGDQHAADMFLELKKHLPLVKGIGMGSSNMKQAGIDIRHDSSTMGVIGVIEVIKHSIDIFRAFRLMKQLLLSERPDLLICVDYKEFNYLLARFAKKNGIKVLFYVSPQVWAWRPGRIKKYGAAIDMMAVIFPFEVAYYEAEKVPVRYVGHPSVDKVHPQLTKVEALRKFGVSTAEHIVGIFPGSRGNEIERMLPVMLEAAHKLQNSIPGVHFLLAQADSITDTSITQHLKHTRLMITVIKKKPYDVIQCCNAIMTTSGTASLEIALLGVPMVITYKLSPLTYWLGRLLVKTPYIGLPNIILGKPAIKELIQHHANPDKIAAEITKILKDKDYEERIRFDLRQVKQDLGKGDGSKNTALAALEVLGVPPKFDLNFDWDI